MAKDCRQMFESTLEKEDGIDDDVDETEKNESISLDDTVDTILDNLLLSFKVLGTENS